MQVSRWIQKTAFNFLTFCQFLHWIEQNLPFIFNSFLLPKSLLSNHLENQTQTLTKKSSGSLGDNTPFAARVREGNSTADAKAAAAVLVWHNTLRKAFYVCVCLTQL